ncbi:MAG: MBL fold metallo-hydrolase [Rubrivivax sp.]|nr:MBL fold metallo-hydrolase [Rubrivivax sp.]
MSDAEAPAPEAPALVYPCGEPPEPGGLKQVAPGVLWLRMPLPFTLKHINLYLIEDQGEAGPGWAVVDTGTQTPEVLAAWRALLAPEGPLAGRPVTRVIATHMHPDHMGMAGWLTRKYDARLWITREEYLMCRTLAADTGREAPEDAIRFYQRCGWPEESLDVYRARFGGFGKYMHALPDSYRRLRHGETLTIGARAWRVVVGRGHSPEHACLVSEGLKVMISGDQVLPRISSNVSVFPTEPDSDPLGDWLDSIAHLRATLPDDLLVLPAHGEPFRGLHARLDRLAHGHDRSLVRLRRALVEAPRRVVDLFVTMFARQIDLRGETLGLATGETVAHLNYLRHRGELEVTVADDGAAWYRARAAR